MSRFKCDGYWDKCISSSTFNKSSRYSPSKYMSRRDKIYIVPITMNSTTFDNCENETILLQNSYIYCRHSCNHCIIVFLTKIISLHTISNLRGIKPLPLYAKKRSLIRMRNSAIISLNNHSLKRCDFWSNFNLILQRVNSLHNITRLEEQGRILIFS